MPLAALVGALLCGSWAVAGPDKPPAKKGKPHPVSAPAKAAPLPLGPLPVSPAPFPKAEVRVAHPPPPTARFSAPAHHTMFRGGPARRGRTAGNIPTSAPSVRWRYRTGRPVFSSPSLDRAGRVYFGSLDGRLYALSSAGKLRWKRALDGPIYASPALHAGAVYVGTDGGSLYRLSSDTGEVAWRVQPGGCVAAKEKVRGFGPERTRCHLDSSPLVGKDGSIYLASDALYAVTAAGKIKWKDQLGGHAFSSVTLDAAGGRLVVGAQRGGGVVAVSLSGERLWRAKVRWDVDSTAALTPSGSLVMGCDDGRLRSLAADTGEERWSAKLRWAVGSSPAVAPDGTILVGSDNRHLYALDDEGQVKWRFSTRGKVRSSPLVDRDGTVLFGSQDDHLYALDSAGKLLWKVKLGGDIDSSPSLGPGGTIYVGTDDGLLYALHARTK